MSIVTDNDCRIDFIEKNYTFEERLDKAIEELGELTEVLQDLKTYADSDGIYCIPPELAGNIVGELADVAIVTEQLASTIGMKCVRDMVDLKIKRQLVRIEIERLNAAIRCLPQLRNIK
mgnify:FL=1